MAAARGEKTSAGLGARGFSLVEVLAAVAVFSILFGCLFLSGGGFIRRFLDPYSDANIAGETARAAEWLDDLIYRATMSEKNFELIASPRTPSGLLIVQWPDGSEEWRSERIRLQVHSMAPQPPGVFRYDWRAQTLTPALTLRVFKQKDIYTTAAGWFIIISGHGLTRASQTAR